MSPERWERVKTVFESAIDIPVSERSSFIDRQCGGDDELRREVESLLESHDDSGRFLEQPVPILKSFEFDRTQAPGSQVPMEGARIGAWQLVREIGRGGMGSVYLALRADREFQKRVAIKLIRRGMESEQAIRRFRNERQILARLEHPNIARLIDGGRTEEGLPYYVMEYVEGEPLRSYCETHSLPARERLRIFLDVCSAVDYAHRRMIIHRDLKPGNILVKQDGTPKLLDFGIAKLLDPETDDPHGEITAAGLRIVTPAYASPEQMRGEAATVRSDIYSLGVVLYELLTGHRPRPGMVETTLTVTGADPGEISATLQRDLHAIAMRAMRPEPARRYESVEALACDLQSCLAGASLQPAAGRLEAHSGALACSVAILPFQTLSEDTTAENYLGLGITDALITRLSNVGRISVRPTSAVTRYGAGIDAAKTGRELEVEYVVEGRLQRHGARVRVTVQLVRVQTGAPVWAGTFDEQFEDLLKLEDSISRQVAQELTPQLTGEERAQMARGGTASPEAHEAYLRGRTHWSKHSADALPQALMSFMQAIAADPNYAHAHAGVADCYLQLGAWGAMCPAESFAAAKESARRALEIDPGVAEAHASAGFAAWAYDRDIDAAAHEFQFAIILNPDYAQVHCWYGLLNASRGKYEMALASLERARKLDHTSHIFASALALCHYTARRFDNALEMLAAAIPELGENAVLCEILAWNQLASGSVAEARRSARRATELAPESVLTMAALAHAEAAAGNLAEARALLDKARGLRAQRYVSLYGVASIELACGLREDAIENLRNAVAERDWWTVWAPCSPQWDTLRNDPRFAPALEAGPIGIAGLPPPAPAREAPAKPRRTWLAVAAACLAIVAGVLLLARMRARGTLFGKVEIASLTTDGQAMRAAISPEGRFVAYTSNVAGKRVLWVRELNGSADYRVAADVGGDIRALEFTRGGTHLAFLAFNETEPAKSALYMVPRSGGDLEKILAEVPGPVSVSADGRRIAFVRADPRNGRDELVVTAPNGGGERKIASTQYPDHITSNANPAWSPDGRYLACAVEGSDSLGFRVALTIFPVDGGAARQVAVPRWQYVSRIAYLGGDRGLVVTAQKQDSSFQQIWMVPYDGGEARRLTADLADYGDVGLTSDSSTMISVRVERLSKVYRFEPGTPGASVEVTAAGGRYFDLGWTPDGRIVYASDATGSADIWIMNGDGSARRRLTSGIGRSYSPVASPDGRSIAYHSNRGGNWNIWKMTADGGAQTQLTTGTHDSNWPQFAPDGRAILYHHTGLNAMFNLWRVPVEGGMSEQLTSQLTMHPAVSPKHGRITCWYSKDVENPSWEIAVFEPRGGPVVRTFRVLETVRPDSELRWTPDGDGITYVAWSRGVANLWVQPIDGSAPRQVTNFPWGEIYSYDWSRDGKLIYSQGVSKSDVVLIRNTAKS